MAYLMIANFLQNNSTNMRLVLIFIIIYSTLLSSCTNTKKIDSHFYLYTGKIDDDISIDYLDKNDYEFIVVRPKVESYVKCGDYIFIVQHPLLNHKVDKSLTNYFIIDVNMDYSDERLQPQSISKNKFDEKFKEVCKRMPIKEM